MYHVNAGKLLRMIAESEAIPGLLKIAGLLEE
jgi:hypothetical protein